MVRTKTIVDKFYNLEYHGRQLRRSQMKPLARLIALAACIACALAPLSATAADAPELPLQVQAEADDLKYSDIAAPGVEFLNYNENTACSFSWAAKDLETGKEGFLTAGHCGKEGDRVVIHSSPGVDTPIGTIEWSSYESNSKTMHSIDLAFVAIDRSTLMSSRVPGTSKVPSRVMDDIEYQRVLPDLCKVGKMTGTTCGDSETEHSTLQRATFTAPSYPGDSGGPVYAQTKSGELVAVGVFVGVPTGLDDIASAQVLSKDVQDLYQFEVLTS